MDSIADGLVMELSAVHLKLSHEGDEQAPVQLFGFPAAATACSAGIGVDPLQLVEAASALRVPHGLGFGHNRRGQPAARRLGSVSRKRSAVRTRRGCRRYMAMPSQ